ncbi:MAG: ABC transporter permease [Bacteroidota bacterium]
MLKNYLKVAFRNLRRHPGQTGINIVGLGMGIACAMLAMLFLHNEVTYDKFHDDIDDIYRVTSRFAKTIQFTVVPDPMVPAAIEEIPDIVDGTRVWASEVLIAQDTELYEEQASYVDPSFFDVFSFPLLSGSRVFDKPHEVMLSPALAKKYFGETNPIGQTLSLQLNEGFQAYTVVGVTAPVPENSSIDFDMLLPFSQRYELKDPADEESWASYGVTGFIQLRADADTAAVSQQLLSLLDKYSGERIREEEAALTDYAFLLSPLAKHHLAGTGLGGHGISSGTNPSYVYILSVIAGLVLLIACFNFMNLSIGQASSRLKEVGVRKVIGAARKQLVLQFSFEALLLSAIAAAIGGILVYIALPHFNNLTGSALSVAFVDGPLVAGTFLFVTCTTAFFAGAYPAIMLAGVGSMAAFGGKYKFGGANFFTRSLVVLQFACTIMFLIGTVFVSQQQAFMRNASLGFEQEQLVVLPVSAPSNQPQAGAQLLERFQAHMNGHPTVHAIVGTSNAFADGNSATMKTLEDGRQQILYTYRVDNAFVDVMEIPVATGRNFDASKPTDAQAGILVNEAFARVFAMDNPVGQVVPVDLVGIDNPVILGVMEDFHFESLHQQIKPVFFHQQAGNYKINFLLARIAPHDVPASIDALRAAWGELQPGYPFDYYFLDEAIDAQYQAEERWARAMRYASWIAIFIACLGLLGLTSITMSKRTKEIGIRKVLGASVPGLVQLLSREFAVLVVLANVLAWPLAFFALEWWLGAFSYQIDLSLIVFAGIGLLTLGIALLTISFQSIRTARANPVSALRYE